jgi:hypothetical protein
LFGAAGKSVSLFAQTRCWVDAICFVFLSFFLFAAAAEYQFAKTGTDGILLYYLFSLFIVAQKLLKDSSLPLSP